MRPPLFITVFFLLAAPCASPQHELRLEARPLERIPETEGSVWNLSDAACSDAGHADYNVYGDTLFSETIRGVRRWYSLGRDTVRFIREESLRHSFEPCGTVATAATGLSGMASVIDTVRGVGFSFNTMLLLREGSYSSRGPVAGRLVVSTGDTVPARMTVEEFRYVDKTGSADMQFPLDAAADSLPSYSTVRHRWFGAGTLPLAVQASLAATGSDGNEMYGYTAAYTVDFDDTDGHDDEVTENEKELIAAAFGAATVKSEGGGIRVTLDAPFPMEVTFEVVSDSGIPYIRQTFSADGLTETSVPASGLPAGRHVAVLSAMSVIEKRLITVF